MLKWHLAMPVLAGLSGWFPGRRLGWFEDLPQSVALEWAFRRARFELSHPKAARPALLARVAACRAEILAVAVADDDLGTVPAVSRALRYSKGAPRRTVQILPGEYRRPHIGISTCSAIAISTASGASRWSGCGNAAIPGQSG